MRKSGASISVNLRSIQVGRQKPARLPEEAAAWPRAVSRALSFGAGSRPCDRPVLSNALSFLRMQCLKVRNRSLQAFRQHHRRPPVQQFLCLTNVRTTLSWIVLWQRTMDDS